MNRTTLIGSTAVLMRSTLAILTTAPGKVPPIPLPAMAFPLAAGSKDAALLLNLSPGGYTVHASAQPGATGVALIEIYDVDL